MFMWCKYSISGYVIDEELSLCHIAAVINALVMMSLLNV